MSIIARLAEKSWQTPGLVGSWDPASRRPPAAKVGLAAFLAVATTIFALLALAYLMRKGIHGAMQREAMGHEADDWVPMSKPLLLWINSGILAASSLAWEVARRLTRQNQWAPLRLAAILGSALGVLFLLGQFELWRRYHSAGYFLAANPANSFFYLLTAVHGLHLIGGLGAAQRTFYFMADARNAAGIKLNIQLCAIYWHFLLIVWIVLLGLLLST